MPLKLYWFFLITSVFVASCQQDDSSITWTKRFQAVGSSSSPKCIDLNEDGILDCVIGAGLNEFDSSDTSVIAINGKNGEVLWAVGAKDQMVGSPVFIQLTDDDIHDVVIGGRGAQLVAINGKSGEVLWRYGIQSNDQNAVGYVRFNFYTPQVIPDINGDGIQEILISNGGNFTAHPYSSNNRFPGVLAILDSTNGKILHAAEMPDGKETYMSPLFLNDSKEVIFGTGGETIGGCLYMATLNDVIDGDLNNAKALICKEDHGFMSPPTITDITDDEIADIIANWHGGEMIALNGNDHSELWTHEVSGAEIYASPTPAFVNEDDVPDFFTHFSFGKWPKYTGAVQHIVDGKTGELMHADSLGCGGFSTALSVDRNADGFSEILFSINDYNCTGIYLGNTNYSLRLWDPHSDSHQDIVAPLKGKNLFSTPWLGDLDNNNKTDLVFCIQANYNDPLSYYGIQLVNMQLDFDMANDDKNWTEYLGIHHNGTF